MDVLYKLRNTVSNTLSNTVSSTAHSLSQLSIALPGNPVIREFEITSQICSAGPGLLWKVYSGFKKSTKQKAAIFVFEKRLLDQWSEKSVKDNIIEILKKGVIQLTKLRHPQILTVQYPLEESRDSLAFATEPVFASLSNIFGYVDNLPHSAQIILEDYKLLDLEMKFGLFQLSESLSFLHNDAKMLHHNLCPENIIINDRGDWKIFGFDFCIINQSLENKSNCSYLDNFIPSNIKTSLQYQSPECIKSTPVGLPSDIFSFGILICFIYASSNPVWNTQKNISNYKDYLEELKHLISLFPSFNLPDSLRETVKLMVNSDPILRPNANQFVKIEYFNNIEVKTLIYLDKIFQWDNFQKSQFYKGLPQILKQFPRRIIFQKVLPALQKEFVNAPMIPFLLPSILLVMEDCTIEEFNDQILPMLQQILTIEEPPEISLLLFQNLELLLKFCSVDVVQNCIMPVIIRALDSKLEQLQKHCLIALPTIVTTLNASYLKNSIIPRMKKICLSEKTVNYSLGVRVNCLLCLSKILENINPWIIQEEILPFLQQIPCAGEPALLMAIIGIFKLILTNSKFGISKEILATKVLPFLLPFCTEQSFTPKQYELLVSLINEMIIQLTTEHRKVLQQLEKTRQFHQNVSHNFNVSPSINYLEDKNPTNSFILPAQTTMQTSEIQPFYFNENDRLEKEEKLNQQIRTQIPLIAGTTLSNISKPGAKNSMEPFSTNNLNQLNWLSNKSNLSETIPNCINMSKNNVSANSNSLQVLESTIQQQVPFTVNWNQIVPQNFNTTTNVLSLNNSDMIWTSSNKMMSNTILSNSERQDSPKLSSEEIMDFLK